MDVQTGLVCGGVAVISAVIIYVITVFSMKEKTYEEAIAEQRKMPEEHLLLGRTTKDKAKDKKLKKLGKKVKEKSAESEKSEQPDLIKSSTVQPSKVHVDFEEPEAEVVSEYPPQDDKKKKKREKVKPILMNKDEHSLVTDDASLTPTNHFEESLPKDDLLLKRKESREDIGVKGNPESAVRDAVKPQVAAKSNLKADSPVSGGTNKQEKEKSSSTKLEHHAPKAERTQSASKHQERDGAEKETTPKPEKANSKAEKTVVQKAEKAALAKQEKLSSPKAEKSEKAAKVEKAPKTDKSSSEKSSLPEKAEKTEKTAATAVVEKQLPAAKVEKAPAAKVEKVVSAKAEKSSTKGEKCSGTKNEKPSGKSSDKTAIQEPSSSNPAPGNPAPAAAPAAPAKHEAPAPVKVEAASMLLPAKEKRSKKKSELAVLQQMSGDRDGVNVNLLLPLVQKAVLSRSEIQILIDQLLNKQQHAGANDAEWIEGRADPVVKLKKQLAERERLLSAEQEASAGVQAKLKALRAELNAEKAEKGRLGGSVRQLEEALQAKAGEAQALAARMQHGHDEKQALAVQLQQLQQKLNEEHVRLLAAQEAEAALQADALAQRQQVERHVAEQEGAFKVQATQLMAQLEEQQQLTAELQAHRDQQLSEKNILLERVAHAEKQLLLYKESSERGQEMARQEMVQQVEELNIIRQELEHRLTSGQKHETALQYEASSLRKEVDDLKAQLVGYETVKNESNRLRADNDKLSGQLHQNKDLQLENQRLRDENERLASQVVILPELQMEALQLREENETLAAQMTAMIERPAAEGRENGDLQFPEEKQEQHKGDFAHYEKTIQQKEGQLLQLGADLEEKSSLLQNLQSEINTYKTETIKLSEELEEQRRKNNESQNVREEEQSATKDFLQRIFPDIRVEDCKTHDQWLERFESSAAQYLSELQSQPEDQPQQPQQLQQVPADESSELIELEKQNSHLQGIVANYKTIIDDTAGMLKQLQNQVEEGEIRWRQQLQVKEAELEAVRQELGGENASICPAEPAGSAETQGKLEVLQRELESQEKQKIDLEEKFKAMGNTIESLKEDKNGLASQLEKEQEKSQELSKELTKLRSLVQIGKDSLSQEHEKVVQLQQQLSDKLNGVHQNHSVSSNGPSTETSSVSQGGSGKK